MRDRRTDRWTDNNFIVRKGIITQRKNADNNKTRENKTRLCQEGRCPMVLKILYMTLKLDNDGVDVPMFPIYNPWNRHHWHQGNHMIVLALVKQPWGIWLNYSHKPYETRTTRMPAFWGYPRCLMNTHTIESYWIPCQKKTKSKLQI